jgi:MacB-like periplasmic core domain
VRPTLRTLRKNPGFTAVAILTLALGIGANVIVFGVLNAIILRPIDVPAADRLHEIVQKQKGDDNQSYPDYLDFRARNSTFEDIAAYRMCNAGLSTGGTALRTWAYEVSGNYFDMLGVRPQLGRFFHDSDEHGPNSAPYIVLSDALWRTRFNADPRVVGTAVSLNKHPFTVIGVAPRSFNGKEIIFSPEFWVPVVNEEQIEGYCFLNKRSSHGIFVIGVSKPGVTKVQAADNLNAVAHQMTRENPAWEDGLGVCLVKPGSTQVTEESGQVSRYCCRLLGWCEVPSTRKDGPSLNVVYAFQIRARRLSLRNGLMSEHTKCRGRTDAGAIYRKPAIVPVVTHRRCDRLRDPVEG